ncbi:TPA: hypothetical protein MNT80_003269 [Citrobacter freundii]|nr:hypothetical protein [Citrobacter freundii]HCA0615840.1 hypothetical protein [Citrobacter freundii]HCA1379637.1 hypothetical protein [Citrobacter freundii]HCA2729144.1 hypothetical protein [Citrobacter freundii]HCA2807065.1 hypothetical protein [Citrobacter freundii]
MFDLIKHLVKNDIQHTVSDNGNITVTHNLDLEDVSGVDALPDNLTVGGWLDLSGTSITALPDNLTVGGSLYLRPEKITNVSYRENCGYSSRTIFAMWTGKEFRIAAGCFFGSIEQFEQAVDDKYDGNAAEAYKKAGRDCVAELTEKLNPKD